LLDTASRGNTDDAAKARHRTASPLPKTHPRLAQHADQRDHGHRGRMNVRDLGGQDSDPDERRDDLHQQQVGPAPPHRSPEPGRAAHCGLGPQRDARILLVWTRHGRARAPHPPADLPVVAAPHQLRDAGREHQEQRQPHSAPEQLRQRQRLHPDLLKHP
jgi:hypothetical protein